MEAIVLAGGFGTRLRQLVPDLPKPMAPIGGRPFLEILLKSMAEKGFSRVILSLGYMADRVIDYFDSKNYAGMALAFEVEDIPLGTGGAVRRAMRRCQDDHIFVLNGDTYVDIEACELEAHWQSNHAPIIVAREVADTARYGRLKAERGRVTAFLEKGADGPGLINAGCYVLPASSLDGFVSNQAFSLEVDFLAKAVSTQRFDMFVTHGRFIDIGVPDEYIRAQTELAGICK